MEIILIILLVLVIFYKPKRYKSRRKRNQYYRKPAYTKQYYEEPMEEEEPEEPEIQKFPYRINKLLTKAEYSFYRVLKTKCDENKYLICPKVRMEDFITVTDNENPMKYRGYIKSRHIDFMLCDEHLRLLAGIELDDNTHKRYNVKKTDDFKNRVFLEIGIPLYRINMSTGMYEREIDNIFYDLKQRNTTNNTYSTQNTQNE